MTSHSVPMFETLDFGITCIDTGLARPGLAACYLMREGDEIAVIETGTVHTVPRILSCIESIGCSPEQVRYVIITHVHLDHAGGAGALMQQLPRAQLVVHPRGARHMIDPAKLQAGAMAVYGEAKYREVYGDLAPIDESRIIIAEDGDQLALADRQLIFYDTPGHARHHFCMHDPASDGIFTGDTLGIAYRELKNPRGNFVMPTTTPVQFDPPVLKASIDRLMTLHPRRFYLTHFGIVEDTERHAVALKREVDAYVAIAERCRGASPRESHLQEALTEHTLAALGEHGTRLSADEQRQLIASDMILNAQGLAHWLAEIE